MYYIADKRYMPEESVNTLAKRRVYRGQRLFYTGDFRGHGRKRVLLERLLENPISGVDCLIMEGSMIGRDTGRYPDEDAVEQAMCKIMANQRSYNFVFCSSQNLDRLVSIYRAVKQTRKTLVLDLYTAFILDKLSSISSRTPQFDWNQINVLYGIRMQRSWQNMTKNCCINTRRPESGGMTYRPNHKTW